MLTDPILCRFVVCLILVHRLLVMALDHIFFAVVLLHPNPSFPHTTSTTLTSMDCNNLLSLIVFVANCGHAGFVKR